MEKDNNKSKVKFLINEKNNELYAFFPEESYTSFPSDLKLSYAHIGQHSACSIAYAKESRDATKLEYNELKEELESIDYDLEILN